MSTLLAGETLGQALRAATLALVEAGIEEPAGDARRLVAEACGGDGLILIREPERLLSRDDAARLADMVRRRAAHEPVSRILGWREFYGRRFAISPDVLDPRADTETLVETALDICIREGWRNKPIRILDLGTGSGCLLLTLLAELPCASGIGLDISEQALTVARTNAGTLRLSDRSDFIPGDMRHADLTGFDLVVSNPPYIRSGDIAGLDPGVAHYDPGLALDGGSDGLELYRGILTRIANARGAVHRQRWLVLEAGIGQAGELIDFAKQIVVLPAGTVPLIRHDLGGVARCVAFRTLR